MIAHFQPHDTTMLSDEDSKMGLITMLHGNFVILYDMFIKCLAFSKYSVNVLSASNVFGIRIASGLSAFLLSWCSKHLG